MAKVEFNTFDTGFVDILKSEGTKNLLLSVAQSIADRAGEGFAANVVEGDTRYNAFVTSIDYEAAKEEAENKVLSSAV